jgi:hypothetical protein
LLDAVDEEIYTQRTSMENCLEKTVVIDAVEYDLGAQRFHLSTVLDKTHNHRRNFEQALIVPESGQTLMMRIQMMKKKWVMLFFFKKKKKVSKKYRLRGTR